MTAATATTVDHNAHVCDPAGVQIIDAITERVFTDAALLSAASGPISDARQAHAAAIAAGKLVRRDGTPSDYDRDVNARHLVHRSHVLDREAVDAVIAAAQARGDDVRHCCIDSGHAINLIHGL